MKNFKNRFLPFLAILIAFLSVFRCSDKTETSPPLAIIGDKSISADDFILSYELTPYVYFKQEKPKRSLKETHLNTMIDKKLLAQEALKKGLDQDNKVKALLSWYQKKAAIKQLYREVVQRKVTVSEKELRQAFVYLNEKVQVQQLFFKDENEAWAVYRKINDDPSPALQKTGQTPFTATVHDLGEFTWGEMDPDFEQAVFQLKPGEISPPFATKWGWHIAQMLSRKRNPLLTETGFQERKSYIQKISERRKRAKLASAYIQRFMIPHNVVIKGQAFAILAERIVKPANTGGGLPKIALRSRDGEISGAIDELAGNLHKPLVSYAAGHWTIADFLEKLKNMPLTDRPAITSKKSLENGIGVMIRDELLAAEAFRRGLQNSPAVMKELASIKEELLFAKLRNEIVAEVRLAPGEIEEYYSAHRDEFVTSGKMNIDDVREQIRNLLFYQKKNRAVIAAADKLRLKTTIYIDSEKLAAIEVTTDWAENPVSLFVMEK